MVLKRYRCSDCGHEFEEEEPPMTIPASGVWCPVCHGIAEEAESRPVTLETLTEEMERIIETEEGIQMTHQMKEVFYGIVRDAWAAVEEAENAIL